MMKLILEIINFKKEKLISIEHLRNIDNNIELFKNQLKDENILQLEELIFANKNISKNNFFNKKIK